MPGCERERMTETSADQRRAVLTVTINRPDARNAVNTEVTLGVGEARFAGLVQHAVGKPLIAAVNGFALGGGSHAASPTASS
jgi:enoyl-CoA hydratase/carnithine racemase